MQAPEGNVDGGLNKVPCPYAETEMDCNLLPSDKKQWTPAVSYGGSPGPRHGHSAVVHGNNMYLFGGLMGLSEQKDFWKWDFMAANWSSIRTR